MKNAIIFILFSLAVNLCHAQVTINRNEQMPVSINDIFFMADYKIFSEQSKGAEFTDFGLSIGQIFTYKKNTDFQSLVLLKVYKFNEGSNRYEEMSYEELVKGLLYPNKYYRFKLLFACMSRQAQSPTSEGRLLNAQDIIVSDLGVSKSEVDKIVLKHHSSISTFVDNNLPKPIIAANDNILEDGPKPQVH